MNRLIVDYCHAVGDSEERMKLRALSIKAKMYGITAMLEHGELANNEETFALIRKALERELMV